MNAIVTQASTHFSSENDFLVYYYSLKTKAGERLFHARSNYVTEIFTVIIQLSHLLRKSKNKK